MSITNLFKIAQQQFDQAAELLGLDPVIREFLRWPQREFKVTLPVRMDNGSVRVFHGYRVQYNSSRGPTKGGLRWHPNETIDTVRALAAWMTWKTAVANIPLGGGKGGVTCNPKELSEREQERLARAYIDAVAHILGVTKDIPAPDVYTTPQIMTWMMDEYEKIVGESHPGVITGKPVTLGGSQGRSDATSRGGIYIVREAARALNIDLAEGTMAINGFGNVGRYTALLGEELLGLKLVAVGDLGGGIYNPGGISAKAAVDHMQTNGNLKGFPDSEPITNEDLLALDVSILFPCALEGEITKANADRIRANVVCELANGPTTPEADPILWENGVFVIPDLLANCGGVTVSYFEQVQNSDNCYWDLDDVCRRLDENITTAFHDVYSHYMSRKDIHMRQAAYMIAIDRVAEACRLRDWV